MRTLQSTIKNGRAVWNRESLPREEFQERVARLRAEMKVNGFDLAFVYGKAFDDKADPCYLSNFVNQLARGMAVVVPSQGAPALLAEGFPRGLPTMRSLTWIEDVRVGDSFAAMLSKYLSESRVSAASVVLVGARPHMPFGRYRELRRSLANCKATDSDHLVARLRRIKSEREKSRIREARDAVAAMFAWLGNRQHPEMTEQALHTGARLEARLRRSEDVRFFLFRPGQGEWNLRPAERCPLEEGERVMIYAAAEVDRYWAEAARTFAVNGRHLTMVKAEAAETVYQSMLAAAVPGAKAHAPVLAAQTAARKEGIELAGDYGYGDGLGLALDEAPVITERSADMLEPGMSFSLRLFTRNLGGWLFGDTLLIPHSDRR